MVPFQCPVVVQLQSIGDQLCRQPLDCLGPHIGKHDVMLIVMQHIQHHFPGGMDSAILYRGLHIRVCQAVHETPSMGLPLGNHLHPIVLGMRLVLGRCRILHGPSGEVMTALPADFRFYTALCIELQVVIGKIELRRKPA